MSKPKTWLCPLCGVPGQNEVRVPYGESCPERATCTQEYNVNGAFYAAQSSLRSERGVGISQISNESENSE